MKSICTPGNSYYYDSILKWLSSKYGEKVGRFLTNRLCKMIRNTNDFCMDNFRVAEETNNLEMKNYKKDLKNGCCGFNDERFIFKEKNLLGIETERYFRIGYNFGH